MILEQETQGDIAVVRPVGRLDSSTSPVLERWLLERLDSGCSRLVFDLSSMDYVSSAGLRVLLLAGKKLRCSEGRLVLSGIRENVRDVFEMSGFLTLFAITDTVPDALARF